MKFTGFKLAHDNVKDQDENYDLSFDLARNHDMYKLFYEIYGNK